MVGCRGTVSDIVNEEEKTPGKGDRYRYFCKEINSRERRGPGFHL